MYTIPLLFALLTACAGAPPPEDRTAARADSATIECPTEGSACVPGEEVCDGIDNDCDGLADEGMEKVLYLLDCDGDGIARVLDDTYYLTDADVGIQEDTVQYACPGAPLPDPYRVGTCEWTTQHGDCDDASPAVFPGRSEDCDGLDNDCDGTVDDGVGQAFYLDTDGDGHGRPDVSAGACEAPDGYVAESDDCDDDDPEAFEGHVEVCDGVDNDCDGSTDEGC